MASFKQSSELRKGKMIVLGLWECTADGDGGFQHHLKPAIKKNSGASSLEELIEGLGEIQLSDSRKVEFEATSSLNQVRARLSVLESTSPIETHPTQTQFGFTKSHTKLWKQFESSTDKNSDYSRQILMLTSDLPYESGASLALEAEGRTETATSSSNASFDPEREIFTANLGKVVTDAERHAKELED